MATGSTDLSEVPVEEGQDAALPEPSRELLWTTATVELLVDACQEKGILSPVASKRERQDQWMAVKDVFVRCGYIVEGFEVLRKKWYRLVDKYKEVKDKRERRAPGTVSWQFFQMLDDVMIGDSCVSPVPTLSTTPLSSQLLWPVSVELSTPGTSGDLPQCPAAAPPSSGPRKRRRAALPDGHDDADLRELLASELKDRKLYRAKKLQQGEEKLRLLRDIAKALATSSTKQSDI